MSDRASRPQSEPPVPETDSTAPSEMRAAATGSDRPADAQAEADAMERGRRWLETLLDLMRFSATVDAAPDPVAGAANYWLTVDSAALSPDRAAALLDHGGRGLDGVQYLANALLNLGRPRHDQHGYTVELDGYRARQREALAAVAEEAVAAVRETGEPFAIESLSPAERKQVHTLLKAYADVETHSEGQEPHRKLIVQPAGDRPD